MSVCERETVRESMWERVCTSRCVRERLCVCRACVSVYVRECVCEGEYVCVRDCGEGVCERVCVKEIVCVERDYVRVCVR